MTNLIKLDVAGPSANWLKVIQPLVDSLRDGAIRIVVRNSQIHQIQYRWAKPAPKTQGIRHSILKPQ